MPDDPAQPTVAADTHRETDAARQRIDGRSARMTALDQQATAQGDHNGQLEGEYNDLDAQNKLDQWRVTHGYLNSDGVVQLPEPADQLDELTGQAPGSTAARNMTASQMNAALTPFNEESMQLSSAKMFEAQVRAGRLSPEEAAVEFAAISGVFAGAVGARRGRRANRNAPPSSLETCPPTASGDPGRAVRVTNKKHHPNSQSPEPRNAQELYDRSIPDSDEARWAKDDQGVTHRFASPTNGETHWNGSTAGPKPIRDDDIPIDIRRALR